MPRPSSTKTKPPRIQIDLTPETLREIARLRREFADTEEYGGKEKELKKGNIYEFALLSFQGFPGPAEEMMP